MGGTFFYLEYNSVTAKILDPSKLIMYKISFAMYNFLSFGNCLWHILLFNIRLLLALPKSRIRRTWCGRLFRFVFLYLCFLNYSMFCHEISTDLMCNWLIAALGAIFSSTDTVCTLQVCYTLHSELFAHHLN